jgi:hypothetical protein
MINRIVVIMSKKSNNNLPLEKRQEYGSKGGHARWDKVKGIPQATHGSPDKPLRIGDIEIGCYVLNNGMRVLSQRGVVSSLGMKEGGTADGADRLSSFLGGKAISPFVPKDLTALSANPVKFRAPHGGGLVSGYPATILADICDIVLKARKAGRLLKQQEHIAEHCETLMMGFAKVGIIALVDEATGYQEKRDKDELHRLLAIYLTEEKLAWAKKFPDEYYRQLYRLRNWTWPCGKNKISYVGHLTNKLVYEKLPAGVLDELKRRNPPMSETGVRRWKHHQLLSPDIGQPDLRDHLLQLIVLMKAAKTWEEFMEFFQKIFPGPEIVLETEEGA